MAYRGRLINPLLAEIYRLDAVSIGSAGYDPIYREPRKVASADGLGTSGRKEDAALLIPAQFEPSTLSRLQMMANGDAASSRIVVVMHFTDLEDLGLVDGTTGVALVRKGARLAAIRQMDETLEQEIPNPPGLFVTEALPLFGLGGRRNLLQVTFESRDRGK